MEDKMKVKIICASYSNTLGEFEDEINSFLYNTKTEIKFISQSFSQKFGTLICIFFEEKEKK